MGKRTYPRGGRLPPPEPAIGSDYDPALVNADQEMAALARTLVRPDVTRALSLLLYGPPGTGKSAYARHLAGTMGLPVLHKRVTGEPSWCWTRPTACSLTAAARVTLGKSAK